MSWLKVESNFESEGALSVLEADIALPSCEPAENPSDGYALPVENNYVAETQTGPIGLFAYAVCSLDNPLPKAIKVSLVKFC